MSKKAHTFNVFLCGTTAKSTYGTAEGGKDHDFPQGELVAWLADFVKQNGQQEFLDYVIFDGVGSGYEDTHKYPSELTDETRYMQAKGMGLGAGSEEIAEAVTTLVQGKFQATRFPRAIDSNKPYVTKLNEPVSDIASMKSEDAQVQKIIEAWKNQEITQVNLIGWSRGGYNAIRIAHKLNQLNPLIAVNILSFDPVPGPGRRTEDACSLPKNVKNYVSLIAENEHTYGFPPVIPSTKSPNTRIQIETYPGVHSSMVGGMPRAGLSAEEQEPLTDMGRQFALKTLRDWGVPISDDFINLYNEAVNWKLIHQHRKKYNELQGTTITGFREESKPHQNEKGEVFHHRYVTYGYRAGQADWAYLDEVPDLQHNKPHATLDDIFEIDPDTCTLHRKFNDAIIAGKIDEYLNDYYPKSLKLNEYHVELLSELHDYIAGRNQLAGSESVLKEALKKVTERTILLIETFINSSNEKDSEFEVIPHTLHTMLSKLGKSYLFLAAETGSMLYIASLGSLTESEEELTEIFNLRNDEGKTPLMIAAEQGHTQLVKILLNLKASVLEENHSDHSKSALDYAAQHGRLEIAKILLDEYSSDESRDSAKIHAMVVAAQHNQDKLVKLWIGDLQEADLEPLAPVELMTLIIWAIQHRNEKALAMLTNNSLVLKKLFEDPSVQFMPNINEIVIWAVTNNNEYLINNALKHWSRVFASDSLAEHPQIDVFLLKALENKRDDVLAAVVFAHPELLELPLNDMGQNLTELGFSTFTKVLARKNSQQRLMAEIQSAVGGKDRSSSFNLKMKKKANTPPSRVMESRADIKKSAVAGVVAGVSLGYFALLAAVTVPTLAAWLPSIVTTVVVSSVTFGVPLVATLAGIIAIGAYLYFRPDPSPVSQIIIPEKNIVEAPPSVEATTKNASSTQKPLIHRHSWSRPEPAVKVRVGDQIQSPQEPSQSKKKPSKTGRDD